MNEKEFDKLNELSVSMENMTVLMGLAEQMLAELVYGNITDDKDKEQTHLLRLTALVSGMTELQHSREYELDQLLKAVKVVKGGVA